jgi:hypothetical protein
MLLHWLHKFLFSTFNNIFETAQIRIPKQMFLFFEMNINFTLKKMQKHN